jgi:hypothetical protein
VFIRGRPERIALSLPFPATLCSSIARAAISEAISAKTRPIGGTTPVYRHTEASAQNSVLAALKIAPPANRRSVASGPDCGAHLGTIGALVCPDMMKSGDLLLIWDWQPGDGPDEIDGSRIYTGDGINVQTGAYAGQLLATRPNKGVTLFDVPKPPGGRGYAGNCYAVTAYAGSRESKPSAVLRRGYGVVGYNYYAIGGGIGADASFAWISRYAMLFDVRSVIGRRTSRRT